MVTLALSVLGLAAFLLLWIVFSSRAWRRWGATDEEVIAHYPHDEFLPQAELRAVRAITIDAPVKDVWPWIAQIGRGAGWYSIDWLDNRGCRSADYLMELPPLAIGDRSAVGPLASFAPADHVAYFDPGAPFLGMVWKFGLGHALRPLSPDRTRVLQMSRAQRVAGSHLLGGAALLLNDVMETIMGVAQLKNLKRMIESYPARLQRGDIHRVAGRHGHQRSAFTYAGEGGGR